MNVLDQIVSEGNTDISTLKNDIRGNYELTFNVKLPTPGTTGCIRHSNKHGRKIKYENLKTLLDSGCSHWWNLGVYIGVLYEVLRILGVILHLKGKNATVFHRFTPRFVVAEAR